MHYCKEHPYEDVPSWLRITDPANYKLPRNAFKVPPRGRSVERNRTKEIVHKEDKNAGI